MQLYKKRPGLLIFACWLAYVSSYVARYSYQSNIVRVIDTFGVSKSEAGLVSTCFFFAYGVGQVVHGLLCRRYPKRFAVGGALCLSALLNLAVAFGLPFSWYAPVWLVNGFSLAVLWPTLLAILAEQLEGKDLSRAIFVMSTTVATGTLLSYGTGALFALSSPLSSSFCFGGVLAVLTGVLWMLSYPCMTGEAVLRVENPREKDDKTSQKRIPATHDSALWGSLIMLGIFAVVNNFVKDGLTTWLPQILKETYSLSDSLSIILTVTLPILAVFGTTLAIRLHKRILSYVALCGALYLACTLLLGGAIGFLSVTVWPVLLCFGCVSLCMAGVNNVVTAIAPLELRDKVDTGKLAGVLDGCCYVGSTLASYALGRFAEEQGWLSVLYLLLSVSTLPVLLTAAKGLFSHKKRSTAKAADEE